MTSTLTKPRRKLRMQAGEPCPKKSDVSGRSLQAKTDPRPENRVVGSGGFTSSCTWSTWSQTPDTHREIETTSTTTVSGALEWLSKDPIGISGGLNQYVFCANNPVNFIDPLGLLTWDPVVHHTGRNGRPVYDGEAFISWYTDYLTQYRWRPWDLWGPGEFLENVDIAVDMSGENFYFRGECYEADEMGNVAAGYGLTAVWGTPVTIFGSVVAEGAGALDTWQNRGPGIRGVFGFYGQAIPDAWGSWSRNSIGWSHRQADDWNENVGDRTPIPGGL